MRRDVKGAGISTLREIADALSRADPPFERLLAETLGCFWYAVWKGNRGSGDKGDGGRDVPHYNMGRAPVRARGQDATRPLNQIGDAASGNAV